MNRYLLLLLALFCASCCGQKKECADSQIGPLHDFELSMEAAEIIHELTAEMQDTCLDIHLDTSYAGRGEKGFYVWLDFTSQELIQIKDARELMTRIVRNILDRLNQHFYIAREAEPFPLTPENLYVNVKFESFYGQYIDPLYVGRMELKDGKVSAFYAHTALNPDAVIFHMHFEPYRTSERLTQIQQSIQQEREARKEEASLQEKLQKAFESAKTKQE